MKKRKPLKAKHHDESDDQEFLYLEYEITYEPIQSGPYERLPEAVKKQLEKMHPEIPQKPQKFLPDLLKLKQKYPQVPQIYNYLIVAYIALGQEEDAETIARECFRENPDYLFARINLAEIYLARGEYEKIPELFHHKYDLKLLHPERDRFHISEAANFMGIMGLYFVRTDQRDVAERYNEILQQIAPDFPVAKTLERELRADPVMDLLEQLLKKK